MLIGLYNHLTITEYTITSNKIRTEIKLILLTDLHSCHYGEKQKQLMEAIENQKPDLVLMSGDIADDVMPDEGVEELLAGIAGQYPCYYVTGNHEFWSRRVEAQKEMFRSYGVHVLEGDCDIVSLNSQALMIGGIDDPDGGTARFEKQLTAVTEIVTESDNASQYSILLAHRPELFKRYARYDFDLVLSGHAHGGQWRLPFILPNGLLAPNQGLFPQYTTGIHTDNYTNMVVSRGLSRESTRIPRFFNPPELVVIYLKPEQE